MAESLIIQLGEQVDDPVEWAVVRDAIAVESGALNSSADLIALSPHAGEGVRVVALLPGEQAVQRSMVAPPRRADRLKAAAELLLEDELAEPPEALHIVTASGDNGGLVLAVRKSVVRDWLAIFAAAGLRLDHLCPDFTALGGSVAQPVCLIRRERLIFSNGVKGFAIEMSLAPTILEAALKTQAGDAKPRVIFHGEGELADWIDGAKNRSSGGDFSTVAEIYSQNIGQGAAVNLLCGEFRRRQTQAFDIQRWRRAGFIGSGLAASLAVLAIAGGVREGRLANQYEKQASAVYRQAFPDAPLQDMRASARAMLASEAGSESFVSMSSKLAAALERHETVTVDRIRFDSRRGQFAFTIRSQTDAEIEAFRTTLASEGLAVRDGGGYRRTNAGWTGDLIAGRV